MQLDIISHLFYCYIGVIFEFVNEMEVVAINGHIFWQFIYGKLELITNHCAVVDKEFFQSVKISFLYAINNIEFTLIVSLLLNIVLIVTLILLYRLYLKDKRRLNTRQYKTRSSNTELHSEQDELKEFNESKSKLFSIIAHDIRSPLHAILRLADFILDKYDAHSDTKRKSYLILLNQAGKELVNLIENLLSWSRYRIGNLPFNPTVFPFIEAVNFSMGILRPMAEHKKINIEIDVNPFHIVKADFSMTSFVIRNITNNAVKFTYEGGTIKIASYIQGDFIKVEITDTGTGIDKELVNNLFILEKAVSRKGTHGEKGSGLGLPLCKEFVEKNGGDITVESEPGKGSKFLFTLKRISDKRRMSYD